MLVLLLGNFWLYSAYNLRSLECSIHLGRNCTRKHPIFPEDNRDRYFCGSYLNVLKISFSVNQAEIVDCLIFVRKILQTFAIPIAADDTPRFAASFTVDLVAVVAGDGLTGSTEVSGASIDESTSAVNVSLMDRNYPYGLLQFATSEPPTEQSPSIPPATETPQVTHMLQLITLLINLLIHLFFHLCKRFKIIITQENLQL